MLSYMGTLPAQHGRKWSCGLHLGENFGGVQLRNLDFWGLGANFWHDFQACIYTRGGIP